MLANPTPEPQPTEPQYTQSDAPKDVPLWGPLVDRIRSGDGTALVELYRTFSRGVSYYLSHRLAPQDLDDGVHEVFSMVIEAIQKGSLENPECLTGFVRTVAKRMVAEHNDNGVQVCNRTSALEFRLHAVDPRNSMEQTAIRHQKAEIMRELLAGMTEKEREVLSRFYLLEQSQKEICEQLFLSETQFRLVKSSAKSRFAELKRRRVADREWDLRDSTKAAFV